jgi:hypothetical protein
MPDTTSNNTAPEPDERGHKRYVYRWWEFDPNGPCLPRRPKDKRGPNNLYWGETLDDFFLVDCHPDRCKGKVWSRSTLAAYGENYEGKNFLREDEGDPRVVLPWPLLKLPDELEDGKEASPEASDACGATDNTGSSVASEASLNMGNKDVVVTSKDAAAPRPEAAAVPASTDLQSSSGVISTLSTLAAEGIDANLVPAPSGTTEELVYESKTARVTDRGPHPNSWSGSQEQVEAEVEADKSSEAETTPTSLETSKACDPGADEIGRTSAEQAGRSDAAPNLSGASQGPEQVQDLQANEDINAEPAEKADEALLHTGKLDQPNQERDKIATGDVERAEAFDAVPGASGETKGLDQYGQASCEIDEKIFSVADASSASAEEPKEAAKAMDQTKSTDADCTPAIYDARVSADGPQNCAQTGMGVGHPESHHTSSASSNGSSNASPKQGDNGKHMDEEEEYAKSIDDVLYALARNQISKLEEFLPEKHYPDVLIIHDEFDVLAGTGEFYRARIDHPRRYRRVLPMATSRQSERIAHLLLEPPNSIGSGHHSFVYRAAVKLPPPLTVDEPLSHVAVAAKVALIPLADARKLLANEARVYASMPRHLQEE